MDRRQLIYFKAVAACEHLGHAAEQLGMTESGISRSLSRLEQEYGTELFDRIGRGIRLNTYGHILLESVDQALATLEDGERTIRSLLTSGDRRVTFGFVMSTGPVVPAIVSRYREAHPDVRCKLVETTAATLREELLAGRIDLCLEPRRFSDAAITWEPLWEEEIMALLPPTHPLVQQDEPVDFERIIREDLIIFRESNTTRKAIEAYARSSGYSPRIVFESNNTSTVIELVNAGHGIAFLPECLAQNTGTAVLLRLRSAPTRTIGVSWNRERANAVIESFRQLLVSPAKAGPPRPVTFASAARRSRPRLARKRAL